MMQTQVTSNRLQSVFRQDAEGMIELLHLIVARLQRGESVTGSIDQAFRYAHSIRSEASFLHYAPIVDAARELEQVLRGCRVRGDIRGADVEKIRSAVVAVEHAFTAVGTSSGAGMTAGDRMVPASLLERPLDRMQLNRLRQSRARGEKLFLVRCRITEDPAMIAPRLFLVVGNLEKSTHVVDTLPRLDSSLDGVDTLEALCTVAGDEKPIRQALMVDAVEDIEIQALDYDELDIRMPESEHSGALPGVSRVSVDIDAREYERLCLHTDELVYQLREIRQREARQLKSLSRASQVRMALGEKLARVVNLTVYRNSCVSARDLLEPLPAIVRRLARDSGKTIRMQLSCDEVALFLPVADVVRNAVLHLIRNAVDHGIEAPQLRRSKGKPEEGLITVVVQDDDPYMRLTVRDDGQGLPVPPAGQTVWDTISSAGFSTARSDANVSGEGVGLDAVRYSIERIIGGTVEVESKNDAGATFCLRIPTGDRPLRVLVVEANEQYTAIPAAYIENTIVIDRSRVSRDADGALQYPYDGHDLPLRSLHKAGISARQGELHGLLLQIGESRQLIVVHRVIGIETVLRDAGSRDRVFSQGVDRTVPLFLPLRYL